MDDNDITALVGWPTEPEMARYRKVAAAAAAAEAAERERWLKAAAAALEVLDDLPEWSNAARACQLLRECAGPNVGNQPARRDRLIGLVRPGSETKG